MLGLPKLELALHYCYKVGRANLSSVPLYAQGWSSVYKEQLGFYSGLDF